MTRLRRTIAARLKEAQNTAAMLTTFNEVDMSAVDGAAREYRDAFEKKHNGVRLGFMSFFVRACCAGAEGVPGGQRRDRRRRRSSTRTSSTWASRSAARAAWWCR